MRHHRITRPAVIGIVVASLAAPVASAQQDLRMPDTRDAAAASILADPVQDLRMPDTRDAATAPVEANARQDLRSPDTRDAAAGRGTSTAPDVTVIKVPQPAPAPASGIDWGDAGMGAAFMLVLAAVSILAVRFRRHSGPQAAISG